MFFFFCKKLLFIGPEQDLDFNGWLSFPQLVKPFGINKFGY